jgi:hypothetical protein
VIPPNEVRGAFEDEFCEFPSLNVQYFDSEEEIASELEVHPDAYAVYRMSREEENTNYIIYHRMFVPSSNLKKL